MLSAGGSRGCISAWCDAQPGLIVSVNFYNSECVARVGFRDSLVQVKCKILLFGLLQSLLLKYCKCNQTFGWFCCAGIYFFVIFYGKDVVRYLVSVYNVLF